MPFPSDLPPYLLAVAVASCGAAGTQLKNSGVLARAADRFPRLLAALMLGSTAAMLAAFFWFSWARLALPHWITFIVASLVLTPLVRRVHRASLLWPLFVTSTTVILLAELRLAGAAP